MDNSDCDSLFCMGGLCIAPACDDMVQNATETDIDCGGVSCMPCADGLMCMVASDCASGVCTGGVCQAPSCMDGVLNGGESATDCGGMTACPRCADGQACTAPSDCVSAMEIELYPTPKTFGSRMPIAPTSRPPSPAFR